MPLPISHSLIGASIIALFYPRTLIGRDWRIPLLGAFFATSPDFDFFLVWFLPQNWEWHRSLTHSIFFALAVTGLMFIGTGFSRIRIVLACGTALLSHGLLDFLTTKLGGGVELLYPFSDERLKLGIVGISEFGQGFYFTELIKSCLTEVVIFAPIFFAVLWIKRYLSEPSSLREDT